MKHRLITDLKQHQTALSQCSRCQDMIPPVIVGNATTAPIMQIGQAPGIHEGRIGKPFGWTAGKALFQWYARLDVSEADFRDQVYMAAVCRCFPGKHPKHGDRVPNQQEIDACRPWLQAEMALLKPQLIIPVGKLAISEIMPVKKLTDVIGKQHRVVAYGLETDVIALPHPSGASTWPRMEPGKALLQKSLDLIAAHPSWQAAFQQTV